MKKTLENYLNEWVKPGMQIGLLGLDEEAREISLRLGAGKVLVCDPVAASQEAMEMSEDFFSLWGNGMGGCTLTGEGMETYLPLECLRDVDLLVVSIPLLAGGAVVTKDMVDGRFLGKCRADMRILCQTDSAVIAVEARGDKRIVIC